MTATALDVRFLQRAKELIDKYGKSIAFYPIETDSTGENYDTATGTTPDNEDEDVVSTKTIVGTAKDARSKEFIRNGARLLYVPAADFERAPKAADRVVFDEQSWRVLEVDIFYSGEQAALYAVYAKVS